MTAQAIVEVDFPMRGVRIALADVPPGEAGSAVGLVRIFQPSEQRPLEAHEALPRDAFIYLRDDEARALYEALGDHFGGRADDTRQLRRDYENERRRVDKVTDALIAIAVPLRSVPGA